MSKQQATAPTQKACFNCENWMVAGRWGWYCFECETYLPTGIADELAAGYFYALGKDEVRAADYKELLDYCERETIRTAKQIDYTHLAQWAFDYAAANNEYTADIANTNALNYAPTPDIYERWCNLCDLIAIDKITTPAAALAYLLFRGNE